MLVASALALGDDNDNRNLDHKVDKNVLAYVNILEVSTFENLSKYTKPGTDCVARGLNHFLSWYVYDEGE